MARQIRNEFAVKSKKLATGTQAVCVYQEMQASKKFFFFLFSRCFYGNDEGAILNKRHGFDIFKFE